MFVEEKEGAASEDAVVLAQLGPLRAPAIHPGAVLGIQILDQAVVSLPPDHEVAARERVVGDDHVGRFVTANRDRLIADFPPLDHCSVFTQ